MDQIKEIVAGQRAGQEAIYRKYGNLASTYQAIRSVIGWGSNPVEPPLKSDFATNAWQGAAYESGLDNSPMYDSIPFNKQTHQLELADAGLTGL